MSTIRLTAAQALVRYLSAQANEDGERFVAGVWAIFGHGNVAGLGEALYRAGDALPTWRGHNEQGMAHAAIAFAKASNRKRAMAVTSSIGPGATNMVTAAAVAHVNRLPVLFLPGDVFANRLPDPVLQQVEDFADGTVSANDCFRPVSRYFDRITRPEQLLTALPRAMATLIDPAGCGPVTLALCQDVQAEAYDYPEAFFEPRTWIMRRQRPDARELERGAQALRAAKAPLIIAGGGVHYSDACETLAAFAERRGIPVAETQAGKSALPWTHPCSVGAIGVTGAESANAIARTADLILAVGTRLQDFTTGSWSLFQNPDARLLTINAAAFDATKHGAVTVVGDARTTLEELDDALGNRVFAPPGEGLKAAWDRAADAVTAAAGDDALPTDAQVIGAVQRNMSDNGIVVCAAGGLPAELHKLWRSPRRGDYHLEYGYS
ncbi:MAG: thiamine pyrophosphate-binding protein, partial [Deltaproteobacteria bacterium]|nr:thiamine pyrophosphate-binding protein [Deltaproteobacteria bacterium]